MTSIIHGRLPSTRRKHKWASAEQKRQALEYEAWQRSLGLHPEQLKATAPAKPRRLQPRTPFIRETPHYPSHGITGGRDACTKRPSVMDNLTQETPETRAEILRKAASIAPAYNKGAYQYITDGTDPTTLGRKI